MHTLEVLYKRLDQEYPQYRNTMPLPFPGKLGDLVHEVDQPRSPATPLRSQLWVGYWFWDRSDQVEVSNDFQNYLL